MNKYPELTQTKQGKQAVSDFLAEELITFLNPLLEWLNGKIDKRLVRTFIQTIMVIIQFRHSKHGLLLSELGGYLLSPDKAPAGTKRISNLLRSRRWSHILIDQFLWEQGNKQVKQLNNEGRTALCVWDESVVEKPESIAIEGLCAVRSSRAARLKRIKKGFYNPPGRPIFVPGMKWVSLLVMGMSGTPTVAAMRWWTSRGKLKSDRRSQGEALLNQCVRWWGRQVIHIWDRGYAGFPWLDLVLDNKLTFIIRWNKNYKLIDLKGRHLKTWQVTRGKRSVNHRYLWDAQRKCWRKTGIVYQLVSHPKRPDQPLWLIVSRPGKGRKPWYLLSSQPILTHDDAWQVVLAYSRRWQIEMAFRFSKSDLAMESPRLWFWHNRLKLLLLATLAYAFLLSLLDAWLSPIRSWLLRHFCHRTGKRHQMTLMPLYRLRSALSRLWLSLPPPSLDYLDFLG